MWYLVYSTAAAAATMWDVVPSLVNSSSNEVISRLVNSSSSTNDVVPRLFNISRCYDVVNSLVNSRSIDVV